jgi:hypothetical protein
MLGKNLGELAQATTRLAMAQLIMARPANPLP